MYHLVENADRVISLPISAIMSHQLAIFGEGAGCIVLARDLSDSRGDFILSGLALVELTENGLHVILACGAPIGFWELGRGLDLRRLMLLARLAGACCAGSGIHSWGGASYQLERLL